MSYEVVDQMLARYKADTRSSKERALREILQELTLVGLWRAKFFEHAAFYGGTALRILYGLDRFSEDLDFTLKDPQQHFDWAVYSKAIIDELQSFGFDVSLEKKEKRRQTMVQSAFLKVNTFESLIRIGTHKSSLKGLHPDALIRIKVEIDTDPILGLNYETLVLNEPLPIPISTVIKPDLFASKMHAALYRAWKKRVKGRDWWDVVWFIRKQTPINLEYIGRCMRAAGELKEDEHLDLTQLKKIAIERIQSIDLELAKQDVRPFLWDSTLVDLWSPEFLIQWIEKIEEQKK